MDLVATAAKTFRDNPALVTEKKTLSFRDLETAAVRIAQNFSRHGIRKGDVVALCMPNSPELVLLLLALLNAEAVSAPLNYRFPAPRLQALLNRLNPSLLIGQETLTGTLSSPVKLTPEEILEEIDTEITAPRQFNSSTTQHLNNSTLPSPSFIPLRAPATPKPRCTPSGTTITTRSAPTKTSLSLPATAGCSPCLFFT